MFHSVLRALRSASSLATRGSCQSEGSSRSFAVWAPFSARQLAACVNFERAQSWRTTLTLSAAVCRADDAQLSSLLVVQGRWTVVACMPAQTRLSDPRSKGGYCAQHLLRPCNTVLGQRNVYRRPHCSSMLGAVRAQQQDSKISMD